MRCRLQLHVMFYRPFIVAQKSEEARGYKKLPAESLAAVLCSRFTNDPEVRRLTGRNVEMKF